MSTYFLFSQDRVNELTELARKTNTKKKATTTSARLRREAGFEDELLYLAILGRNVYAAQRCAATFFNDDDGKILNPLWSGATVPAGAPKVNWDLRN